MSLLLGNVTFELFYKQTFKDIWLIMVVCIYEAIKCLLSVTIK